MSRTCPRTGFGRTRWRALALSTTLLAVGGLIWDGSHAPAAAQAYNGGPNQVIVNMDVLNGLPGGNGAGYGAPAQPYGQAPKSQFLPGTAPQGYAAPAPLSPLGSPLGAPRYLPPYTPYGVAAVGAQPLPQPLPLAPGLAVPPSSTPSSVLTTLGPDGRPIQPIKLKQPGTGTKQAAKPKKKTEEYAAPAQPAAPEPTETASAPEPAPGDEQVAAIEPPTPPAEPAAVPDEVPMPESTPPAPSATGAIVETAPAVTAPEPPASEPAEEQVAAPEAPAPEAPAEEAPAEAATAEETPAEEPTDDTASAEEAPAEEATETAEAEAPAPDESAPAAPIPQGGIRIVFPTEVNEVPVEANAALDDLASQMLADENMRVQIMCYASGTEEAESKARRKSLARCINIRQYLFKKDVRTTRMDVRALGLKSEGQPADRVDIVPASS